MTVSEALRLSSALLVPWAAGFAWVRWRWRDPPAGAWSTQLACGYVLGHVASTLLLLGLEGFGLPQSFALPLAIQLLALGGARWSSRPDSARDSPLSGYAPRKTATATRIALVWLGALLALRLLTLGSELWLRPLSSWDAWTTWAPKARVWFETRRLVGFAAPGDPSAVASGLHEVASPHYPPTVPLIQLWYCMALGRWDDTLMNVAWIGAAAALALGLYGGLRSWGASPLVSLLGSYAVLSLPVLNTQVAIAGTADLWMATTFGRGSIRFFSWLRWSRPRDAVLAVLLVAAGTRIKAPGVAWALTLLPALALRWAGWRALVLAVGGVAAGAVLLAPLTSAAGMPRRWEELYLRREAIGPMAENLFLFASWHLFWYVLPLVVVLRWRRFREPLPAQIGLVAAAGVGALLFVYLLTPRALWAVDSSQLNRAALHIAPMLAFAAAALLVGEEGSER